MSEFIFLVEAITWKVLYEEVPKETLMMVLKGRGSVAGAL